MKNTLKLLPLVATFLFAPAYAEEKIGGYVGASGGQISVDFCDDIADCDDKGFAFRGFGGYQVNKYLAVEMGGTYASELISGTFMDDDGSGGTTREEFDADYKAVDVSVLGRYPFNDLFAVSARVGIASWKSELSAENNDDTADGTDWLYGAGLELTPGDSFVVRAEWTRTNGDDNLDIDYLSLSGFYNF